MLDSDFALSCFLPDWDDLLVSYQAALQGFATGLRTVAGNFDRAGNSGDIFAAPRGGDLVATLTLSDIDSLDLTVYATKAAAFKRCVAQLQSAASDLQSKVVAPLKLSSTWDCSLTADGQRVAHVHASTVHHAIDALEMAYLTFDHLAGDLAVARKEVDDLVSGFVGMKLPGG